jgi:hypothetical protein
MIDATVDAEEEKEKERAENEEAEKEAAKDLMPEWEAPTDKEQTSEDGVDTVTKLSSLETTLH